MQKKKLLAQQKQFSYKSFSFAVLFLLVISTFISITQIKNPQTTNSKANTTYQDCTVSDSQLTTEPSEQSLFIQINNYRIQHGVPPLVWSQTLKKAAEWRSNDMSLHNSLNATDSLGRIYITRITECGYTTGGVFGENVDSGTGDPNQIISTWQQIPAYNANLLNPSFKEGAVAVVTGANATQTYWTFDLAGPQPTPTPVPTNLPMITPPLNPTINGTLPGSSTTYIPLPTPSPLPTKPFTPTDVPPPTMTPVPTVDPAYIQNAFDTQVVVSAKVFGIGGSNPKHLTRKVDVEIYNADNAIVLTGHGFIKYNSNENLFRGIIHLGKLNNDIYYVKIGSKNMLKTEVLPGFQEFRNDRLNILPQITIRQGDLNADNAVTLDDYNTALTCFQNKKCDNPEDIDFNDDGITNITDYNILLQSFGQYKGD